MRRSRYGWNRAGFTALELAIAMATAGALAAVGYSAYRNYNDATVARRAAQQVGADLALARSHAIKRRGNVSLVVDEAARTYRIRDESGRVLSQRYFDDTSDMPLSSIRVGEGADSVTFNSRGMLNGAPVPILVRGRKRTYRVTMNALGRSLVSSEP